MTTIRSVWAATPPAIDGEAQKIEWADGGLLKLPHARVFFKNDASNLYVLLDVIGDTVVDKPIGWDYFRIAVDVDRSMNVTPNTDIVFIAAIQPDRFLKQYYLAPDRWTGSFEPVSESATQFGPSFNSATPHRIWELALNLEEIGADPVTWWGSDDRPPVVRLGLRIASKTPTFVDEMPGGFLSDFAELLEISLATQPDFPTAETGPIFSGVGFIPYRAIDPGNGHATTEARAALVVENGAFGRRLDILGDIDRLWGAGVRRYRIKYSRDGGDDQNLRQSWTNYKREFVDGEWKDVLYSIGPDADGIYDLPNPEDDWLTANLLLRWQTRGFGGGNGFYNVWLDLLPEAAGAAALSGVPAADRMLNLAIDNTAPSVDIPTMQHGGGEVGRCAIVHQGATGFRFQITVNDLEGHLQRYSLTAFHGDPGEPAEFILDGRQTYDSTTHGPSWSGGDYWAPEPGHPDWRADESCSYEFRLVADARITNGYWWVYQDVWCSKYVTILVS